ncbi:hypothetical protein IIB50_02245 [Patescibacteria group bacterium]|nr:hypothetical protein [Patescibacteria group bacterium]
MKDYDQTTEVTEVIRKPHEQVPSLKRLAFWWQDIRVVFYKYFNLDYSKVVGLPMTRKEYKKWQKTEDVRHFKCSRHQVCGNFANLSPYLPTGDGWMSCQRDSEKGFKCSQVTRACLHDDTIEITPYM